jgi:uncharacterized protein (TIGR03435 family)
MNDDLTLLREFAASRSEAAFVALVSRHINLVYSVALRQVFDPHLAEEITQAVFIILARKADKIAPAVVLPGWLCRTARYVGAQALREQRRRQQREQEAHMQSLVNESEAETWPHIAPLLDAAMETLGRKDHDALMLRFFEGKNFVEVGAALGTGEDTARMRVNRALEKLRKFFTKRGVISTTAILAGAISANSVQAAPTGLAKTISVVALAKGAAAGTGTLSLVKGALKMMAWTKMKMAVAVGVGVLLVIGTTFVTVGQNSKSGADDSWRSIRHFYSRAAFVANLDHTPPQVTILPTIHPQWGSMWGRDKAGRGMGINSSLTNLLADAYGMRITHMIFPGPLDGGKYDFIANLPQGSEAAFQQKIKEQFGVVAHKAVIETDVWVLKAGDPEKLSAIVSRKKSPHQELKYVDGKTIAVLEDQSVDGLADALEGWLLQVPVVNQTGLSGHYDLNLNWDHHDRPDSTVALINQLHRAGFELVSNREKFEMLIVEKVK